LPNAFRDRALLLKTRHTGLVVRDLERSLAFYRDLLGLSVLKRALESGPYIEELVGIPGARLEWIKLQVKDGSIVELITYLSPPAAPETHGNLPSDRVGCSHIAFTVSNLEVLYIKLEEKGYRCNSLPQASPDGAVKAIYCHDPDGIIVELVEELAGPKMTPA
jgi:catechol 2,3-dioxygenase-like lactoylglutathione lyase family enzyme